MIIAIILCVIIPSLTYIVATELVTRRGDDAKKYRVWLFIAMAVYVISWVLPSPLIEGKDTSFSTHFVGGGLFTGFVWYYLKQSLGWKAHWLLEAFSLFVFVSALGVANELFEIVLYLSGHMSQGIADTSWDLVANTLGALLFYAIYVLVNRKHVRK